MLKAIRWSQERGKTIPPPPKKKKKKKKNELLAPSRWPASSAASGRAHDLHVVGGAQHAPDARREVSQNSRHCREHVDHVRVLRVVRWLFLLTQVFQFLVLGYGPLETGVRFSIAGCIIVLSPLSPRFAHRFGTKLVVCIGLLITAAGLAVVGHDHRRHPLWARPGVVVLMASGIAVLDAPATESIIARPTMKYTKKKKKKNGLLNAAQGSRVNLRSSNSEPRMSLVGHSRLRWSRPRLVHVRFTSDSDRQPSKRDPSLRANKRPNLSPLIAPIRLLRRRRRVGLEARLSRVPWPP